MNISTIGLDLAKNVFQVHAIDDAGEVIVRRSLRRRQVLPFFAKLEPCLIGMEACGTSHHWARELETLGHEVKLMPPAYVKPYVKRGKTDAADAEAIAEAVRRPTMRFVAIKTPEQQSVVALHRTRNLLIGQRTQLINMVRSQLAEYGIALAKGIHHALRLIDELVEGVVPDIPALACKIIVALASKYVSCRAGSSCLKGRSRVGSAATNWPGGSKPSRGSATSRRLRWQPLSPIPIGLHRRASLPPHSG